MNCTLSSDDSDLPDEVDELDGGREGSSAILLVSCKVKSEKGRIVVH